MKLNSMDVQNINAMLGKLLWSVRKTSQAARAHGQTKPEPKHPQFVGQWPAPNSAHLIMARWRDAVSIRPKPEVLNCVRPKGCWKDRPKHSLPVCLQGRRSKLSPGRDRSTGQGNSRGTVWKGRDLGGEHSETQAYGSFHCTVQRKECDHDPPPTLCWVFKIYTLFKSEHVIPLATSSSRRQEPVQVVLVWKVLAEALVERELEGMTPSRTFLGQVSGS